MSFEFRRLHGQDKRVWKKDKDDDEARAEATNISINTKNACGNNDKLTAAAFPPARRAGICRPSSSTIMSSDCSSRLFAGPIATERAISEGEEG